MENWLKKRAALYQLIKMVDENDGSLTINTDMVKRVFNDENDIVRIEYTTGEVALLADADYIIMNDAIIKFRK